MSGRRNLDAGGMPSWSTLGLMSTGVPSPLDRDLVRIPAELRPRAYEVNAGRTVGGGLGLGGAPSGADYLRPGDQTSAPVTAAMEGCEDCA